MDERECLVPLIAAATLTPAQTGCVQATARLLVDGMRARQSALGIESLTRAFPLNSPAGLALLSLAEALLRIPDRSNASRLLRDRLGGIDWRAQTSAGWLSSWLHLASRCVRLRGPVGSLATPVVLQVTRGAIQLLAAQFVFAEDIHAALRRARRASYRQSRFSFDMLGEAAMTEEDAQRYLGAYDGAIAAIGATAKDAGGNAAGHGVSVKLSAIHPRYHYTQRARVMNELLPRLQQLAHRACREGIALTIDAEESERLELSLDLIEVLMRDPALRAWDGLGVAVQAYQKRAPAVIDYLLQLARTRPARLQLRLVKGAYWDAEIKLTQMEGLVDYPVYTRKVHTDVAYAACARKLLGALGCVYPQFATHNAQTVAQILELADGAPAGTFEFQRLHGMGAGLYAALLDDPRLARPVRVYAPVGTRPTLLAYLMRRLLENGAAASFVQRAADPVLSVEDLIADPIPRALAGSGRPHPQIALPRDVFLPLRLNAAGVDLSDPVQREPLESALAQTRLQALRIEPLIAAATSPTPAAVARLIRNPADRNDVVGSVYDAGQADIAAALRAAREACGAWGGSTADERAQLLERAAALFEQHAPMLVALAVRESGKSLANAVGEVREAVDYLRYYAARVRIDAMAGASRPMVPLGVIVCISPWNFPLAIFTGQVSAALAAGNTVLAKPAEQSSALGFHAVRLLHEAGIPRAVLQLLPGSGEEVGAGLTAGEGVDGVIFTGSGSVARAIAQTLAQRGDVPLIAETGGQNAMIVDSSALAEQVVADVLRSAFDSAGQRCSALRLLCLQREMADPVLTMLEGAMRELRVGDPARIETDVGPLIDEEARERIRVHLQRMQSRIRCQSPMAGVNPDGFFIAPTLIEIDSVGELTHEVFGPVLHVLRYDRQQLDRLIRDINATGYGLTMGVASRVGQTVEEVAAWANVGNLYINRNTIGAVVGLQPFGGRGLSGTGPKAGGPWYLHRLVRAQPSTPAPTPAPAPATSTVLRGYVGEHNELRLQPLGLLRATGRSPRALMAQLRAATVTGNHVIADDVPLARALCEQLPGELRTLCLERGAAQTPGDHYAAVLVDGREADEHSEWLRTLLRAEAAREGAIIPVLISGPDGYVLERLLREQTLTSNTAAVGGDIRLLTLSDA